MIEDFLSSATFVDIVILLVAMAMFVAGWLQGAIRGLLSSLAFLVAFILAAGLRDTLGEFLAANWTHYARGFNFMLALLGLWLALSVTFQIGLQVFYRRITLHQRLVIVDEIVGGLMGAFQVFLVIALVSAIFASFYDTLPPNSNPADTGWARSLEALLDESNIVGTLRQGFLAGLLALLSPLLPGDVAHPTRAN